MSDNFDVSTFKEPTFIQNFRTSKLAEQRFLYLRDNGRMRDAVALAKEFYVYNDML